MFLIWNQEGVHRSYAEGLLEPRRVERINRAEPIERGTKPPQRRSYREHLQGESRQKAISAAQLMSSPVVTLNEDDNIQTAWELIRRRRFRHIPIVKGSNRLLVGILSDRDLIRRGPEEMNEAIAGVMATPVLSASPDSSIREVARVMFEERVGAVPIVDSSREIKGILTRSDILRALVNGAPLHLWI